MKIRNLFLLLANLLFLASCDKTINGTIKDNFGTTIEGVEVKIKDSDFKSITDKKGYFDLKYVPGKINIKINKSGYISSEKNIEISEKSDYPLGIVELIKYPDSASVSIIGEKQYVFLPFIILKQTKENKRGNFNMITTAFINKLPEDLKFKFIDKINTETIKIVVYKMKNIFESVIVTDNIVSIQVVDNFGGNVKAQLVKSNEKTIEKNFIIREIPKKNNIYCLIPIEQEFGSVSTKNIGLCFKVSNDSLFVLQ